jgi:hypothetical protein
MSTALGFTFNANTVEPQRPPEAVPTGWYNVAVEKAETLPTKAQDGTFVAFWLRILDGSFAGHRLVARLNLGNKNPVAVEIAYKELSAICHSTGVIQLVDFQQLYGIPFMVRAVKTAATGQYDEGNDVKGYAKSGEKQTAGAAFAAPTGFGGAPAGNVPGAPPAAGFAAPQQGFTPPAPPQAAAPTFTPPAQPQPEQAPAFVPPAQQPAPTFTPPAQGAPAFTPPPAAGAVPQHQTPGATAPWAQ